VSVCVCVCVCVCVRVSVRVSVCESVCVCVHSVHNLDSCCCLIKIWQAAHADANSNANTPFIFCKNDFIRTSEPRPTFTGLYIK